MVWYLYTIWLEGEIMEKIINTLVFKYYNDIPLKVTYLGGGFYGKVYLADFINPPYKVVFKFFLCDELAKKENDQLRILSKHSTIKIPQIYFLHNKDNDIPYDVLAMEYISGLNAGLIDQTKLKPKEREYIADKIIDNLISYHQTINPKGFGEINSKEFDSDFRTTFKKKVDLIITQAKSLYDDKIIDEEIYNVVLNAYENFDRIFYLPITKACLIHGDYNTWNILLNKEMNDVVGVIDPYNCCFADSELDLYQLDNGNGTFYNLLNKYKSKVRLSENFELKIRFYEVFIEIMHYHNLSKINKNIDISTLPPRIEQLQQQMNYFGIYKFI